MNGRIYPTPDYAPHIVINFYKLLKNESECPVCRIQGDCGCNVIEYHHIDRQTKTDTISNMVYNRAPLAVLATEIFKYMPLCRDHHRDYHQHEHNLEYTNNRYDFINDRQYQAAIMEFHATAWLLAPRKMRNDYLNFMENGFEMCDRQNKPITAPAIPNRYLHGARA